MPPRKKSPEPDVIRVKRCWSCDSYHEFRRGSKMSKVLPRDKKVQSELYGWIGLNCPTKISVYIEDFDIEESDNYKFP